MREKFEFCTTVPHDEPCIQMGEPDYHAFSKMEARALINQIKRKIGEPPFETGFKIVSCAHDFGVYHDVVVVYDDEDEESQNYMLKAESALPSKWDKKAIEELKEQGYPIGKYDGRAR